MEENMKADKKIQDIDTEITNFQYLWAKVEVLEEEIQLLRNILNQNGLVYIEEIKADSDLEDRTWKKFEDIEKQI